MREGDPILGGCLRKPELFNLDVEFNVMKERWTPTSTLKKEKDVLKKGPGKLRKGSETMVTST